MIHSLRTGFDFGLHLWLSRSIVHPNHRSTELAPEFIDKYIAEERAVGRYSGPFSQQELERRIGFFVSVRRVARSGPTVWSRLSGSS